MLRSGLADKSAAGVKHDPNLIIFIKDHFNEVISTANFRVYFVGKSVLYVRLNRSEWLIAAWISFLICSVLLLLNKPTIGIAVKSHSQFFIFYSVQNKSTGFSARKTAQLEANMQWSICKIAGLLQDSLKALRGSGIQFILSISLFLFLQNIFQNGSVFSINGALISFVLHIKLEWSSNSC